MNGGDLPSSGCAQIEAKGAGDWGKGQVGTQLLLQMKRSLWGFRCKDRICLIILHFNS